MKQKYAHIGILLSFFVCLWGTLAAAETEIPVDKIFVSQAMPINQVLFSDKPDFSEIIDADHLKRKTFWPRASERLPWQSGKIIVFDEGTVKGGTVRFIPPGKDAHTYIAYAFFYLEVERHQELHLEVDSPFPFGVFVDGEQKLLHETMEDEPEEKTCDFSLKRGKHRVLLKTVLPRDAASKDWQLEIHLSAQFENSAAVTTNSERLFYRYDDLRFIRSITDLALSPDGKTAAIVHRSRGDGYEPRATYIELWDMESKSATSTISKAQTTDMPVFSPDSRHLVFRTIDEGTNLWIMDLRTGHTQSLLRGEKSITNLAFAPDGKTLYFIQNTDGNENADEAYTLYAELRDKLNDWLTDRAVFAISIESGAKWRLTGNGDFSIQNIALSPDGKHIAYSRMVPIDWRPFFRTELWIQDLDTGSGREVLGLTTGFENSPLNLTFSPDSKKIAFTSPPDTVGNEAPEEHNIYNSDLFVLDLPTGTLTKITEGFAPAVEERAQLKSVRWSGKGNEIYFLAVDKTRRKVFRVPIPTDLGKTEVRKIKPFDPPSGDVSFFSNSSRDGSILIYASTFNKPGAVYLYDRRREQSVLVSDPNKTLFETISLGTVTPFDFTNRSGLLVTGWIFKPVDFDPSKKYPLIVYYYGGVSPRVERFRFMYHMMNANGYVVYVLNPSGAVGAGDAFADLHLNDWGTLVSDDIINGVEKVIAAHTYIDPDRIGAFGGSYGGFITMDLVTKTVLFNAACSLFGISDLTSYWGAGMWGYTYGDMAFARSYPWKDVDIFVEKSPIYNADKVETPILFLHGSADVNVPPGESRQMFTALRVLGKNAVLVEFAGEGHGIGGDFENLVEHHEMLIEWFDKYLKGEGEAWEARWK